MVVIFSLLSFFIGADDRCCQKTVWSDMPSSVAISAGAAVLVSDNRGWYCGK